MSVPARIRRRIGHVWTVGSGLARTAGNLSANAAYTASNWVKLKAYVSLREGLALTTDGGEPPVTGLSVALVAHAYYPELVGEILACWRNMPAGTPLFVTTAAERADMVRAALRWVPEATVIVGENRGRDVAPFIDLMRTGGLDRFDVVLKLHTKRSPHLFYGDLVRRALYLSLAGSRRDVGRILGIFSDPAVGMVGWRSVFLTTERHWCTNRSKVSALAGGMGVPMPATAGFFGGTMFWFRPRAIRPLLDLPFQWADFEAEAGQLDGTLHHAMERCFPLAVNGAGFSVRDTFGRELAAPVPHI